MTFQSTSSRKSSKTPLQQLTYIANIADNYSGSVKIVRKLASKTCSDLKNNKMLSKDQCITFINALKDMDEPLSLLCSTFAQLSQIPDELILFRSQIFLTLCDTQSQATQVEDYLKRYYEYLVSSYKQTVIVLKDEILPRLVSFQSILIKSYQSVKKIQVSKDARNQTSKTTFSTTKEGTMPQETLFTHGYALIIGVGGDLPTTTRDAIEIHNILTNPQRCAYPSHQAKLLIEQEADRQGIINGINWLIESVRDDQEATAIVYFSGHGGYIPKYHLIPSGYNSNEPKKTAISDIELTQMLQAIQAQKLLIFLDCCYAAGMTTIKAPSIKASSIPPNFSTVLTQGSGRVFIASSRNDETSHIGSQYSEFTQALREGLAGYGTSTRDGYAYVADIALYVGGVIPGRTKGQQHPVLDMRKADNFPVAYYAGGVKTPVRLIDGGQNVLGTLDTINENLAKRYRAIFQQYQHNLVALEERMSVFVDQATVPLDWERIKESTLKKMAELEKQIQALATERR
jgi:Caspase domain.